MNEIINRVEKSGLVSIDLEQIISGFSIEVYDLKDHLFQGLVLREKEFRAALKNTDWSSFEQSNVAIHCSVDAIVPIWAYMLVVARLEPYVNRVIVGSKGDLETKIVDEALDAIDWSNYQDAKVVIKGCSDKAMPLYAYGEVMRLLIPYASSIMFGEPCSTVPLYKTKKP